MFITENHLREFQRTAYIGTSKAVRLPSDLYCDFMLITANCGRGKTHYALSPTGLLAEINDIRRKQNLFDRKYMDILPEQVLFLTSRKAITVQQLKGKNVIKAVSSDFDNSALIFDDSRKGRILMTTAHQFGEWVKDGHIQKKPKVIIVDELHSVFAETAFADSLIYTLDFIKENYADLIKVGLTATPQFLYEYIAKEKGNSFSFKQIDIDLGSKYLVDRIKVVKNGKAETILNQILPTIGEDNKVIFYTMSAKQCYLLAQEYNSRKPGKAGFLISDYNESMIDGKSLVDIMNEQGIKQYIMDYEEFPKEVEIIFINSACREGMNIKDSAVQTVICESVDMITIEQILGRIRGNIKEFYVVANFNNYERLKKNIESYADYLKQMENAENPQMVMSCRFGEQKQNKKLQKIVYQCGQEEYRMNPYLPAYLKYMEESYIQLKNNEKYSIVRIDNRDLRNCQEYLEQLCRYAKDGKIEIETVWNEVKKLHNDNALERFKRVEKNWLDTPIDSEKKKELVAEMGAMRSNGKKASWKTVKELLLSAGYTVAEKRTNQKRFVLITK